MGRNINGEFEFDVIRHKDTAAAWSQELKVIFVIRGNGWLHTEEGDMTYAISRRIFLLSTAFRCTVLYWKKTGWQFLFPCRPPFWQRPVRNRRPECELQIISA